MDQFAMFLPVLLLSLGQGYYAKHTHGSRFKRMVNGKEVDGAEWSFAAWIIKDKDGGFPRYCGGSLVSPNWVLTATHCVDSVKGKPWKLTINIGSAHRLEMTQSPAHYLYHVDKIILHSGYSKEALERDDVALLHLNRSVSTIPLPRLAKRKIRGGDERKYTCKAAGWGKYQVFASHKKLFSDSALPSKRLMEIVVPLITTERCIESFGTLKKKGDMLRNQTEFAEKSLCGGSKDPKHGTACLHDSGSPLVCKDQQNITHLQGVAIAIHGPNIFKNPCKPGKQIIIFMRVAHYYEWIKKIIGREK